MNQAPFPRRLAAIVIADVVGYTRLMERDDAGTLTQLRAIRDQLLDPKIAQYGGHIVRMVGDGMLLEFGSADAALRCAVDVQSAMAQSNAKLAADKRVQYRIGINIGDIIVEGNDIAGDGVNVAARLEGLAEPGGICVSAAVREQVHGGLDVGFDDIGQQKVKNIVRPIQVYRVSLGGAVREATPSLPLPDKPSIAVLAFQNMSGDPEQEYFADGLAEELLNVLSKVRGLRVASRTSAFSFKGTKVDIPTVAQKLNVATILEGSVRKSGKRVRITAQLVQVATDSHLWSETYDRELEDIFAVQDDIAQSVVNELRKALMGGKPDASASSTVQTEVQVANTGRGESAEAYRLYLLGRFLVARRTREDVAKGVKYLKQAVELDSEYALGWAALAYAQAMEAGSAWTPYAEGYGHARKAAERALALEPDLAEGHVALGRVRRGYDWDWSGADASLRRALELAPGNAEVVLAAALVFGDLGRLDEAIALSRRGIVLDPLNAQGHCYLGGFCLYAGLLEHAEAPLKEAIELNPQGGTTYHLLGEVYLAQGRLAEALAAFEKESHEGSRLLGLSVAYHALGRKAESAAALEQLSKLPLHALSIAKRYAYCGDIDQAFAWLERAYAQRNSGLSQVKLQPMLRNLHGDPRWKPFLKKMGFAD